MDELLDRDLERIEAVTRGVRVAASDRGLNPWTADLRARTPLLRDAYRRMYDRYVSSLTHNP